MGKRSTNTTKSGKFMNPTDQARKEARRRELKKNKKQRQMVRCQFYISYDLCTIQGRRNVKKFDGDKW